MNKYELLIFDLDGTIADTQRDLAAAVNSVRVSYGKEPIGLSTLRTYIGNGIAVLMQRAMPGLSKPGMSEALDAFKSYYQAHLLDTTTLYPGVRDALDKYAGVKKAVLTNKNESLSRKLLEGLGVIDRFALVWGGDTGARRKPDPEPVLKIMSLLKTAKEKTIMIGDGPNDILAAKNAGIQCVSVTYGYSGRKELEDLHPDYMIDRIDELSKIID